MTKIDPKEYRKRLDRITELFSGMVRKADALSRERCPYRDRHDDCTAGFRCRNQRPPREENGPEACGHDGQFDYRSAWESQPNAYQKTRERIAEIRRSAAVRRRQAKSGSPED